MMLPKQSRLLGAVFISMLAVSACSRGEAEAPAAGGGGGGRGGGRGGGGRGAGAGAAVPVTVTEVTQKDVPREITVIGTAEASMIVGIRAQITGTLTKVNFKEGDDVE